MCVLVCVSYVCAALLSSVKPLRSALPARIGMSRKSLGPAGTPLSSPPPRGTQLALAASSLRTTRHDQPLTHRDQENVLRHFEISDFFFSRIK